MLLPKNPPLRDQKYLDWLKTQPCIVTGEKGNDYMGVDGAHLRYGYGAMGMKPPDSQALPLRHDLHQQQHQMGEVAFWLSVVNRDPHILMTALEALANQGYWEWKDG